MHCMLNFQNTYIQSTYLNVLSSSYKPVQILLNKIYCQNFAKVAFSCIFRSTGILMRSLLFSNSYIWIDRVIKELNTILQEIWCIFINFNLKLDFSYLIKKTWYIELKINQWLLRQCSFYLILYLNIFVFTIQRIC